MLSSKGNPVLRAHGRGQLLSPASLRTGEEGGGSSSQYAPTPPMLKGDASNNILQANMSRSLLIIPANYGTAL